MNWKKTLHYIIDWAVILIFLFFIWSAWISHEMWEKVTYIAPVGIFFALGTLFLNHISLIECFRSKDTEFFLMSGGILLGLLNILLIHSGIGAIFTLADFLLILYLANKVYFDKIQLGAIAFSCLLIWFYWQFIDKSAYGNTIYNPNGISLVIFSCFCVFTCYLVYLLSSLFKIPKWIWHFSLLLFLYLLTKRVLSFNARGIIAAIASWMITYYLLPKKKFTIPLVIGTSLLIPAVYVILWKMGYMNGIMIMGKRLASGRDRIWHEFFNVFIQHPITGIGSNFEELLPDLSTRLQEAHHALLDLLFVHGLPVFLIIFYLLMKRIGNLITDSYSSVTAVCLASVYGMLASGTFENYYIVSPYNVLMLMIFLIFHSFIRQPHPCSDMTILTDNIPCTATIANYR